MGGDEAGRVKVEMEGVVKESQGGAGKDARDTRHPSTPPLLVPNKS